MIIKPLEIPDQGPPKGQNVLPQQRRVFSQSFGKSFQSKYNDAQVSTQGYADTTLKMKCQAISKAFAVEMTNKKEALSDLREMGFKKLIMTDGYKSNWEVDLRN